MKFRIRKLTKMDDTKAAAAFSGDAHGFLRGELRVALTSLVFCDILNKQVSNDE